MISVSDPLGAAPRISVAMATHNGARFIAEQLASLAAQDLAHALGLFGLLRKMIR